MRRATDRFVTRTPGVETWHGFSFGRHYDPGRVAHGPLLVHDEHRLDPGAGFGPHPHRDLEIVSWVLEGALVHEDEGGTTVVPAGGVQRTTAGTGVVHAERAGPAPARFLQLWLAAATPGLVPSYEQVVVPAGRGLLQLVPVGASRAAVHLGRLAAGEQVVLPAAGLAHLHVAGGEVALAGVVLGPGDTALATAAGAVAVRARQAAEVLLVTVTEA